MIHELFVVAGSALVEVVALPFLVLEVLVDLVVLPSEAVVAEPPLHVAALAAELGVALLADVDILDVHAAYLADRRLDLTVSTPWEGG